MPPKRTPAKTSQATAARCACYTNKGSRCSRKSVINGYCKQHSKKCSYKSDEEFKARKKKTSGRQRKSGRTNSRPQLLAIEDKKPEPTPRLADFRVSKSAPSNSGSSVSTALNRLRKKKLI